MKSIAVRDFRVNPGKVWGRLKKAGRMVITSSGKPIALLTDIHGSTVEDELRIDALARGAVAVSKLRQQTQNSGISNLSMKEIEAEIKKSRKNR